MTNDTDLTFTIDVDLFLELLLYRIRAKTIKFGSSLKKSRNIREQNLIKRILELETKENEAEISNTLEKLKVELLTIREKNLNGEVIRSRAQTLQSGEKPTQ